MLQSMMLPRVRRDLAAEQENCSMSLKVTSCASVVSEWTLNLQGDNLSV